MIDSSKPIPTTLIDVPSPEIALSPDGHPGYPANLAAADTIDVLKDCCGDATREFPQSLWLEKDQREDKARENDMKKTWGINFLDRFTNQPPTHECTTHMLRAELEACRNRQRGVIYPDGPKKDFRYEESGRFGSVWLSPLSVYAEANPRQRGGAGCGQVLEIACRRGMLPETMQPRDYKFKHAINGTAGTGNTNQASGPWVPLSKFPPGWEETAKLFIPQEVIFTTDPEQALCLLCWGHVLGYGRSGHAIPPAFWNFASNVVGYVDSYNVVRFDSWNTFRRAVESGVHCVASMTTPDNWDDPAAG